MSRRRTLVLAPVLSAVATLLPVAPVQAYPIDCAILLCLAGGWPASVECAQARTVFIARITPWPIEPPLQIWRCPMRAAFRGPAPSRDFGRVFDAEVVEATVAEPAVLRRRPVDAWKTESLVNLVAAGDYSDGKGADVDLSGPEFDFVRSIRVFSVEYARQWWGGKDGDCKRMQRVRLGSYGVLGEFGWSASSVLALPAAFDGVEGWGEPGCRGVSARAVFIEWRDHAGEYGFEQVDY